MITHKLSFRREIEIYRRLFCKRWVNAGCAVCAHVMFLYGGPLCGFVLKGMSILCRRPRRGLSSENLLQETRSLSLSPPPSLTTANHPSTKTSSLSLSPSLQTYLPKPQNPRGAAPASKPCISAFIFSLFSLKPPLTSTVHLYPICPILIPERVFAPPRLLREIHPRLSPF